MASLLSFSWENQCTILVLCLEDLGRRQQAAFDIPRKSAQAAVIRDVTSVEQTACSEAGPGVPLWYLGRTYFQVFCVPAKGIKVAFIIFVLVKFHHNYSYMNHLQKCVLEQQLVVSVLLIKHRVRRTCLRNLSHNKILVEWEWLCCWLHIHWWIVCPQMLKSC